MPTNGLGCFGGGLGCLGCFGVFLCVSMEWGETTRIAWFTCFILLDGETTRGKTSWAGGGGGGGVLSPLRFAVIFFDI